MKANSLRHLLVAAFPPFLLILLLAAGLLVLRLVVWYSDSKKEEAAHKKAAEEQRVEDAETRAFDSQLSKMGVHPHAWREAERNRRILAQLRSDIESLPEGFEREWKLLEIEIDGLRTEMDPRIHPKWIKATDRPDWPLDKGDLVGKRNPGIDERIKQMDELRTKQKEIEIHLGDKVASRFESEIQSLKTKITRHLKKENP